jgi:uncharacterized protein involved in exopolysaccharide biosynthesis
MLRHYLELLRFYRRSILVFVVVATVLACAGGTVRLAVSPVYSATASVAVLPTAAEFEFGRDTGAGSRSASYGLAATFMEYFRSRPVVEAAVDRISAGADAGPTQAPGGVGGLAKATARKLSRLYRRLDSGGHHTKSDREKEIDRLSEAIRLEPVPSSFILRLSVRLEDPAVAAASANALAASYVERVSDQFANSAGEIGGFLQRQIELRETEMKALNAREEELRRGFGSASLETERLRLLDTRERDRQELLRTQGELQSAEAELEVLAEENPLQSGRSVAELNTTRALAEARRQAAERSIQLRRESLDGIDATLAAVENKEEPLGEVQRRIVVVSEQLAELQTRMLTTNLAGTSAMATVRVIDPAVAPLYPESPRVVRDTVAVMLAALLLSLVFIVMADTLSETVKTTADLDRITGTRSLGVLPVSAITSGSSPTGAWAKRASRRLSRFGADLELGLVLLGEGDERVVSVTGFTEPDRIGVAATTVGAALAARGLHVSCALPDGVEPSHRARQLVLGRLDFSDRTPPDDPDGLQVVGLAPVSARLRLADSSTVSRPMVCVVPVGQVDERDVAAFHERARKAGLSALAFALVRS